MSKRNLLPGAIAFVVATLSCVAVIQAQNTSSDPSAQTTSRTDKAAAESNAFLGVGVEALPPALAAQLHEQVSKGGLLVSDVADDSPAAKAGIKQYDILTTCDDQKLMAPEQLINLIRAEKPGKKVTLGIIRDGKSETLSADLGEVPASERAATGEHLNHARRQHRGQAMGERFRDRESEQMPAMAGAHGGARANWDQFESLNLEKTGKDQFKAAIAFRNEKGEIERREFKGTREEIHKDIHNMKDLPRDERSHLLAALDMQNTMLMPGVRFVPGEGLVIDLRDMMPDQSQESSPHSGTQF